MIDTPILFSLLREIGIFHYYFVTNSFDSPRCNTGETQENESIHGYLLFCLQVSFFNFLFIFIIKLLNSTDTIKIANKESKEAVTRLAILSTSCIIRFFIVFYFIFILFYAYLFINREYKKLMRAAK